MAPFAPLTHPNVPPTSPLSAAWACSRFTAGVTASDDSKLRPSFDRRFAAVLDSQPSSPSSFDLAMEADLLLRTTTDPALIRVNPVALGGKALPQSPSRRQWRHESAARGQGERAEIGFLKGFC